MLRSSPLLEYGPTALLVTAWVGATTAFFAATSGLLQNDSKRVIAYSTCSQLGYIFMALGLSQHHAALYHLVCHAAFKALLFLSAGSVIHAMADQQDVRRLGGLVSFLPFTYVSMLVGSLSLMALPALTGFYSKDPVLELALGSYTVSGQWVFWLGSISAGLTAFYSFRLLLYVFFSTPAAPRASYEHTHDAPALLGVPMFVLALLSIFFGYAASDLFHGMGTDYLGSVLFQHPDRLTTVEAHFGVHTLLKLLPSIITLAGASLATYLYTLAPGFLVYLTEGSLGRSIYVFLNRQWEMNSFITGLMITPFLSLGHIISKTLDRGVVEAIFAYGPSTLLPRVGTQVSTYDTSVVTAYALYIMLGLLTLVLLVFTPILLGTTYTATSDFSLLLVYVSALGMLPVATRVLR